MILPVIMAGGTGSRLWPMSRKLYPKQFLSLYSDKSMLQETLIRLENIESLDPLVICNEAHRFLVAEQLRKINKNSSGILLESVGKNTAPAIALAALKAISDGHDPLLLILAADHIIHDNKMFKEAIESARKHAQSGKLVTFGIVPNKAETGYGYIQRGAAICSESNNIFHVRRFVEKPDINTAISYLNDGEYFWNSGMFLFKASTYLSELEKFRPDILSVCKRSVENMNTDTFSDFIRIDGEIFDSCVGESIDYAVMEHTEHAVVVPLNAGWNDVGSWSALWEVSDKNSDGNVLVGDVYTQNASNSYINTDEKFTAVIGVDDLVVINTKDALLVVNKNHVQDVKDVIGYLKDSSRSEYISHRESYLPWGHSDNIVRSSRYNVNKLTVKPGGKLSLQMHHHRTEHWVILSGTALVTLNDKTYLLTEDQSTYIPVGAEHMIENPGKIPLEVLEIQSGSYLGTDDIVRLKDHYDFN